MSEVGNEQFTIEKPWSYEEMGGSWRMMGEIQILAYHLDVTLYFSFGMLEM